MQQEDRTFTEFVAARSTALLRTAYLLTGERGLAEDLLQTCLVKCYVSWGRLREPTAGEAYVRRALVNTAISWWRRRSWSERPTSHLSEKVAPDCSALVDERDRIWAAVCLLPPRQRAVVVLRFYEDLPVAQVAELLGCAAGTVKSHTSRALATLQGVLEQDQASAEEGT